MFEEIRGVCDSLFPKQNRIREPPGCRRVRNPVGSGSHCCNGMVRMAGANANAVFSGRQGDSMAMISNYIHVKSSPSSVHGALASSEPNNVRLAMIALLLGWIWLAGLSSGYTMGGLVHLLPVVAIAIALVCLARQDRVRAVTKLFLKSALGRRRK